MVPDTVLFNPAKDARLVEVYEMSHYFGFMFDNGVELHVRKSEGGYGWVVPHA